MTDEVISGRRSATVLPRGRILGVSYLTAVGLMLFGFAFFELLVRLTAPEKGALEEIIVLLVGMFLAGTILWIGFWLYRKPLSDEHTLEVSKWGALGLTIPTGVVLALALNETTLIGSGPFIATLGAGGVTGALYGTVTALNAEAERVRRLHQRNQVLQRVFRHNIRNGMNVVQGYSRLLSEDLDEENKRLARKIEREARSVVDLADIARGFETIEDVDEQVPIDLVDIVSEVIETLTEYYPEVEIETDLPAANYVQADDAIEIAVWNLLEFAIHRSSDAPVSVRVTEDEGKVKLTVIDRGTPISEEAMRILERGSEAPLEHMDGVDLWVVKWLFETLGAELHIGSNDATGMRAAVVFDDHGRKSTL